MVKARPYPEVLGCVRGLRRGLTTGTCAQAAAKAAAMACLGCAPGASVEICLPPSSKPYSGAAILVPLAFLRPEGGGWRAGVRKDPGDDADATEGLVIEALVALEALPGRAAGEAGLGALRIDGGRGVGRVTRPGLPVPPGQAAINPTPRRMIARELAALLPSGAGFSVLLEIPGGEEVAASTWNPRLGIEGGLSIIGSSGVVEPASSAAFKKSLVRAARTVALASPEPAYLTPGYVGETYLRREGVPEAAILVAGDHLGLGLKSLARHGARRVELVGHAGKLLKVSAGLFNTHCRYGDARLETLAAFAGAAGAPPELIRRLLELDTAEEASRLVIEAGYRAVFDAAAARAARRASLLAGVPVEAVFLALDARVLGRGSSA